MIGAILDSLKGELDLIFKIEISFFVIKVCIGNNLFGNKKSPAEMQMHPEGEKGVRVGN